MATRPQDQWSLRIVNAETGTGKTTLLTILLGMMGKLNTDHRLLVATPFKDEASRLANDINRIAGTPTFAIAQHGEAKGAYTISGKYPCKVITTNAYIRALHDDERRETLYAYGQDEKRGLTIIDEALSPVSVYKMTADSASRIDAGLPEDIILEYGMAAHTLNEIKRARNEYLETGVASFLPFKLHKDTDRLLKAVQDSKEVNSEFKHEFENTVNMLRAYASDTSTRFVISEGRAHAFYAAQSEPILTVPAVILDATAELNLTYALLPKSKVQWVPIRPMRNYRNATLRVLMNIGTGKNAVGTNTDNKLNKLWRYTAKYRLEDIDTAIFSHLNTRDAFNELHKRETVRLDNNPRMSWGYYGKLNGLNEYKECHNLITASFPHQTEGWAISLFEALRGIQTEDWRKGKADRQFIDNNGREYADIVNAIRSSYYAYTIIQEINRIAIRKNVSADGDCPVVSIVHMWAADSLAFQALMAVKKTMTNINLVFDYGFSWEDSDASRLKKLLHVLTFTPPPYRMVATELVRNILEGEERDKADLATLKARREDPFADELKPTEITKPEVQKIWERLAKEISKNQIVAKKVLQAMKIDIRKSAGKPTLIVKS